MKLNGTKKKQKKTHWKTRKKHSAMKETKKWDLNVGNGQQANGHRPRFNTISIVDMKRKEGDCILCGIFSNWAGCQLDWIWLDLLYSYCFYFNSTAQRISLKFQIFSLFILCDPYQIGRQNKTKKKKDKTNNILRNKFITNAFGEKITIAQRLQ